MATSEGQLGIPADAVRQRHVHDGRFDIGGHVSFRDGVRFQRGFGLFPGHRRRIGYAGPGTESGNDTAQRALGEQQRGADLRVAEEKRKNQI